MTDYTAKESFAMILKRANEPRRATFTASINPRCMLHAPSGAKCFLGVLIPDECYEEDMEDFGMLRLRPVLRRCGHTEFVEALSIEDMGYLTSIHDKHEWEAWHRLLTEFGERKGML